MNIKQSAYSGLFFCTIGNKVSILPETTGRKFYRAGNGR